MFILIILKSRLLYFGISELLLTVSYSYKTKNAWQKPYTKLSLTMFGVCVIKIYAMEIKGQRAIFPREIRAVLPFTPFEYLKPLLVSALKEG